MVGSLLRPKPLKDARAKREKGQISAEELTAVEDAEIKRLVAKEAAVGLTAITDGEARRAWWHSRHCFDARSAPSMPMWLVVAAVTTSSPSRSAFSVS